MRPAVPPPRALPPAVEARGVPQGGPNAAQGGQGGPQGPGGGYGGVIGRPLRWYWDVMGRPLGCLLGVVETLGEAIGMRLGCYWDAIGTLLGCHGDVIGMLSGWYGGVMGMLLGCYWDVAGMLWGCLLVGCRGDVIGMPLGCQWDPIAEPTRNNKIRRIEIQSYKHVERQKPKHKN